MTAKTAPANHAKPAAKRSSPKQAASSYAAKRRLLTEKLETLRAESEDLSAHVSQMLRRFSS